MLSGYQRKRRIKYSKEVAQEILVRLANGESLRRICMYSDHLPSEMSVRRWAALNYEGFGPLYNDARNTGLDCMADEMLDIADDGTNDYNEKFDKEGVSLGWQLNGEHVQRSKLRTDVRKWYLSKLASGKYGDKIQNEITNPDGSLVMSPSQVVARLEQIQRDASERVMAMRAAEAEDLSEFEDLV